MSFHSLGNSLFYNITHNIHSPDRFIPLSSGRSPHIAYINYYSSLAMHTEATVNVKHGRIMK
jgi:hypothetical protein